MTILKFACVHRGIHISDNFKHFSSICSVSIFQKTLLGPNYFFVSGAARRGAQARHHKGGRPTARRLKIASSGSKAAGDAPEPYPIRKFSVTNFSRYESFPIRTLSNTNLCIRTFAYEHFFRYEHFPLRTYAYELIAYELFPCEHFTYEPCPIRT